ncbi:hypothetical protein HDU79_010709 [Rhizoclosmatium sp. JEL0117]|nr:hypothetical protein HDU79_010709 [Rhizoclosmatium sp. JEL0117]
MLATRTTLYTLCAKADHSERELEILTQQAKWTRLGWGIKFQYTNSLVRFLHGRVPKVPATGLFLAFLQSICTNEDCSCICGAKVLGITRAAWIYLKYESDNERVLRMLQCLKESHYYSVVDECLYLDEECINVSLQQPPQQQEELSSPVAQPKTPSKRQHRKLNTPIELSRADLQFLKQTEEMKEAFQHNAKALPQLNQIFHSGQECTCIQIENFASIERGVQKLIDGGFCKDCGDWDCRHLILSANAIATRFLALTIAWAVGPDARKALGVSFTGVDPFLTAASVMEDGSLVLGYPNNMFAEVILEALERVDGAIMHDVNVVEYQLTGAYSLRISAVAVVV